jgi:hypothetical protein
MWSGMLFPTGVRDIAQLGLLWRRHTEHRIEDAGYKAKRTRDCTILIGNILEQALRQASRQGSGQAQGLSTPHYSDLAGRLEQVKRDTPHL